MDVIRVRTCGVITAFTGRTRTVTPLGAALEVVLAEAVLAERDDSTEITAETGVSKGVKAINPTPPPRQIEAAGQRSEQSGRR